MGPNDDLDFLLELAVNHGGLGGKNTSDNDNGLQDDEDIIKFNTAQLKTMFNQSVQEELKNFGFIKAKLKKMTALIKPLQEADISISLDIATLDELKDGNIQGEDLDQTYATLNIYNRKYLIVFPADNKTFFMSKDVLNKSRGDRNFYVPPSETHDQFKFNYISINLDDAHQTAEFVWAMFNTAAECAAKQELSQYACPAKKEDPDFVRKKTNKVNFDK